MGILAACVAAATLGTTGTALAVPFDPTDRLNEFSAGIPAESSLQEWANLSGFHGATVPKPSKQKDRVVTVAEFGTGCIAILQDGNYIDPLQPTVVVMNRYTTKDAVRIGDHPNGIVRLRNSTNPEYIRGTLAEYGYDQACA